MSPFTVLITGGTGFVGRWLISELEKDFEGRNEELKVRVISRTVKPNNPAAKVEYIRGSIANPEDISKAMEDVICVFHIAAMKPTAGAKREVYYNANVLTTEELLKQAALTPTVKYFIYCSTAVGLDGTVKGFQLLPPFLPLPSKSGRNGDYAWSKYEGEILVNEYSKSKQLATAILRVGGVYGPGDKIYFDQIKSGGPKFVPGSGKGVFDVVDVQSVATAHVAALKALRDESKSVSGKTYNVGNCLEEPYMKYADFFFRLSGKKPTKVPLTLLLSLARLNDFTTTMFSASIAYKELIPSALRATVTTSWQLDCTTTKQDLGWEPVYKSVEEAREAFLRMGDDHP